MSRQIPLWLSLQVSPKRIRMYEEKWNKRWYPCVNNDDKEKWATIFITQMMPWNKFIISSIINKQTKQPPPPPLLPHNYHIKQFYIGFVCTMWNYSLHIVYFTLLSYKDRLYYQKPTQLIGIIYYIIKIRFKRNSCIKWLHHIVEFFFRFLDFFLNKYIYNFSSPIISKLIKILI